jgi:hypothetical protein
MRGPPQVSSLETELERLTEYEARESFAKQYFSAANKAREDVDAVMEGFIASNEIAKVMAQISQSDRKLAELEERMATLEQQLKAVLTHRGEATNAPHPVFEQVCVSRVRCHVVVVVVVVVVHDGVSWCTLYDGTRCRVAASVPCGVCTSL